MITKKDLYKIGATSIAKVKETTFVKLDKDPPLALHDYLKVPKGSIVGLIDDIDYIKEDLINTNYTSSVRVYAFNGNAIYLVLIDWKNLEIINEKGKEK